MSSFAARRPGLGRAAQVADLAAGLEPRVGVKKSGSPTRSPPRSSASTTCTSAASSWDRATPIHLRKKGETADTLVFRLEREDDVVRGEVDHPGDARASALPSALDDADATQLERLWQALVASLEQPVAHKSRLLALTLDEAAVVPSRQGTAVVHALVELLAPTVREIARRSRTTSSSRSSARPTTVGARSCTCARPSSSASSSRCRPRGARCSASSTSRAGCRRARRHRRWGRRRRRARSACSSCARPRCRRRRRPPRSEATVVVSPDDDA
ncbi:MAG: hypothetical protein R2939_04945 [Kofleriaceae bacterium]